MGAQIIAAALKIARESPESAASVVKFPAFRAIFGLR
jgi:hypothetical protein